jgi:4-hydroxybutyrate CoA-transferase
MDWREEYKRRLRSEDEAVKAVKEGDRVVVPLGTPRVLPAALARRRQELGHIDLRLSAPAVDPGWLQPGWQDVFNIEFEIFIGDFARHVTDDRRGTYLPNTFSFGFKPLDEGRLAGGQIDVLLVAVTPPDERGYCTFGPHHWNKRSYARRARTVIAEVDPLLPRMCGDCFVHVSELDHVVELPATPVTREMVEQWLAPLSPQRQAEMMSILELGGDFNRLAPIGPLIAFVEPDVLLRYLGLMEPPDSAKAIAGYLNELVPDGATIQIGIGEPSALMVKAGAFNNKVDLGLHTEMVGPGLAKLVAAGVINGKRKAIHKGKAVAVAWSGSNDEDLAIIEDNPAFELYDPEYLLDIRVIAQNDNYYAINNALSVDLTGQINSESVFGGRMINGTGGQPETHLGALFSKGGRAITLLPSTALAGSVSRVVAQQEEGSLITIPRFFADIVISEYGVAELMGKNHRQRAEELIAIAHPDFRAELKKEAQRLFYP